MKIAIIGSGNLGLSIAKGLVYNNTYTSLYLTKRDLSTIEKWEEYNNVKITSDNQEAVKNADILIFTVQPRQFDGILEEIKGALTNKHVLISAITGYSIVEWRRNWVVITLSLEVCQILRFLSVNP